MGEASWFLVRFENGRPEIISEVYDDRKEAMARYDKTHDTTGVQVCETIYR